MISHPSPASRPSRRRVLSLAGLGVLGLALAGCTEEDSLAQQANSGDQKGYIAGDGTVSEYPADQRGEPVQFTGTLFDGTTLSAEAREREHAAAGRTGGGGRTGDHGHFT